MKIYSIITGSVLVVMLAGCSAAYKTGQTTDDVYYSPAKADGADVQKNKVVENDYSYNQEDDNYLRMKVQNRSRWSSIDDYAYWNSYNTTSFGTNIGYSNYYNNYWNNSYYAYNYNPYTNYSSGYNYYNPYYGNYNYGYGNNNYKTGVYHKSPVANSGPRTNLNAYQNHTFSNQNSNNGSHTNFSNGNTPQTGVGRLLRTIVSGGTNNSTYNPARTYNNTNTNTHSPAAPSSSSPAPSNSRTSSTGGGVVRHN